MHGGIHRDTSRKLYKQIYKEKITKYKYKCICLNARSILNKRSDPDFMRADIEPDIIGITESWAHKDIVDAELMLAGYVMFQKHKQDRKGGGVIMYIKDSI